MNIVQWFTSIKGVTPPEDFFCPTPERASSRVTEFMQTLIENGWDTKTVQHINNAIAGILRSRFERNFGQWNDIEGCWLQFNSNKTRDSVSVQIADRGAVILLSPTATKGKHPQDMLDLTIEPLEKTLHDALGELEPISGVSIHLSSGKHFMMYGVYENDELQLPLIRDLKFSNDMKIYGVNIDLSFVK